MMNDQITFLNKLPLASSNREEIIIQTTWNQCDIEITILLCVSQSSNGFTGSISKDTLESKAKSLEIPYNEFLQETKNALTTPNGLSDFLYQWTVGISEFSWRKTKSNGLKIIYGNVELSEKANVKDEILVRSIDMSNSYKMDKESTLQDLEKLQLEHKELYEHYEQCVELKNNIEKTLLSKFILLLNSKKEKIAELQEQIKIIENNAKYHQSNVTTVHDPDETDDSQNDSPAAIQITNTKSTKWNNSESSQSQEIMVSSILPQRTIVTQKQSQLNAVILNIDENDELMAGPSGTDLLSISNVNPYDYDTEELIDDM